MHGTLSEELDVRLPRGYGGQFYGVYVGVVTDLADPDNQGRVKIRLPWSPDNDGDSYEAWARLATMMAGENRGTWFVPDQGDEVLVAFEAGDPRRPYVIGALWNGKDAPPESMDSAGSNDIKAIRSRNGVRIVLDDATGSERLLVETPAGQQVLLDDGARSVSIKDASGNEIKLDSSGITITASAKVTVEASTVELNASMVSVNAGMAKFSGVVQASTVIASSVVSSSYTPGAGNIW